MRIYGARALEPYIQPLGQYDGRVFSWSSYSRACRAQAGYAPVATWAAAAALARLQESFPLGWADDLALLCVPLVLGSFDSRLQAVVGVIGGEAPAGRGLIAIGAAEEVRTTDVAWLADLAGHELTHVFLERACRWRTGQSPTMALRELGALAGVDVDASTTALRWQDRPQEQLSELVSGALWGLPVDRRMAVDLTLDRVVAIRQWAERHVATGPARFDLVDGPQEIRLRIGDTTALVDGRPVTLDVPAQIVGSRTMVPVRFVSDALGFRVEWDGATRTVTIRGGG